MLNVNENPVFSNKYSNIFEWTIFYFRLKTISFYKVELFWHTVMKQLSIMFYRNLWNCFLEITSYWTMMCVFFIWRECVCWMPNERKNKCLVTISFNKQQQQTNNLYISTNLFQRSMNCSPWMLDYSHFTQCIMESTISINFLGSKDGSDCNKFSTERNPQQSHRVVEKDL